MEHGWFACEGSFRGVWDVVFHGLFLSFVGFSFVSATTHDTSIIPNTVCRVKGASMDSIKIVRDTSAPSYISASAISSSSASSMDSPASVGTSGKGCGTGGLSIGR